MNKENKPCPICHGTDLSLLGISCKYCNGIGLDPVKRPDENKPRQCDNNELKPCPFCGGKNSFLEVFISKQCRRVRCADCESCGPFGETAEEAWKKWNKRSGENAKEM